MDKIPSGIITFLFSDIEGSAILAQKFPGSLESILAKHDTILEESILKYKGYIFKKMGDAFYASFDSAKDAVAAAVYAQEKISKTDWMDAEMKVRMGVHTGEAEFISGDYVGYLTLTRVQRLMSSGSGGQILISKDTFDLLDNMFQSRDLGERRLKDLIRPVHIYQIISENFPVDFSPIKTLDARQHNLPAYSTAFIGRINELKEIKTALEDSRLITLAGPGGTGKSRLAVRAAEDIVDEFRNGVWFVELASITDPANIEREIASVLKVNVDSGKSHLETITEFIGDKEMLIILDNCEHLIDAASKIADEMLMSCRNLKIIATTREVLNIHGETRFIVPSLSLPDLRKRLDEVSVAQYEAVRLFIDRALQVNPEFSVTNSNAPAVAELCCKLDGIPLAIELAAARIRILSPENILKKISDRFRLLTTGSRTALPRQQTLRALIDWSYELLSENEKAFFVKLAIFSGGWTLEASEAVCSDDNLPEMEILDLLSRLIDKSLIVRKESGGTYRYTMLETIKQYADEKITERNLLMRRHYDYFFDFCSRKLNERNEQAKSFKEVRNELDNIRASINWGMQHDPELALRLANESQTCWELDGNISEGYEIYRKLFDIEKDYDNELLANALINAGFYASELGELKDSINYLESSRVICERLNDKTLLALCFNNIGNYYFLIDDIKNSQEYHEKALQLGKETGDPLTIGLSTVNLASVSTFLGDSEKAYSQYMEGLKIFRELGEKLSIARLLIQLGSFNWKDEEKNKNAKAYYEESIPILKEFGDYIPLCYGLINLGNISMNQGNMEEAETLYEESLNTSKEYGYSNTYIHALIKLAEIEIKRNDLDKAKMMINEVFKMCKTDSDKYKLSLAFRVLGLYFAATNMKEESIKAFLVGRKITNEIGYNKFKRSDNEVDAKLNELRMQMEETNFQILNKEMNEIKVDTAIELVNLI